MADRLLELVYAHPELADLDPEARRAAIESLVRAEVGDDVAPQETARLVRTIDGFGPLTELLEDDEVTDVLVNGHRDVWVERNGRLQRTDLCLDHDELDVLLQRLVARGGSRFDPLHPMTDVALANGDRLHVVGPPIAPDGPVVSIRRFPKDALTLHDLVTAGTISPRQEVDLAELVRTRASIAISGATGVGKTTLLGALLSAVADDERVVVIEETRELRPRLAHAIHLTTRSSNIEGSGAVTSSDLVRTALRMRPDRLVVGEVRGPEAADALWAISTGHAGSMLTVHARGPEHVPLVLAGLAAGASPMAAPELAVRFTDAIDAFVHLQRVGSRRVVTALVVR
jgi:pilus assembly protein CpaF